MRDFMDMGKCKDCKWWDDLAPEEKDEEKSGVCRRNAPSVQLLHGQSLEEDDEERSYRTEWPFTNFDDWCGEFEAKEITTTEASGIKQ